MVAGSSRWTPLPRRLYAPSPKRPRPGLLGTIGPESRDSRGVLPLGGSHSGDGSSLVERRGRSAKWRRATTRFQATVSSSVGVHSRDQIHALMLQYIQLLMSASSNSALGSQQSTYPASTLPQRPRLRRGLRPQLSNHQLSCPDERPARPHPPPRHPRPTTRPPPSPPAARAPLPPQGRPRQPPRRTPSQGAPRRRAVATAATAEIGLTISTTLRRETVMHAGSILTLQGRRPAADRRTAANRRTVTTTTTAAAQTIVSSGPRRRFNGQLRDEACLQLLTTSGSPTTAFPRPDLKAVGLLKSSAEACNRVSLHIHHCR